MNDAKQQVVDRLKQANNILVTVRTNPSVDLLSACIGLALSLDKLGKHAAAVFSGEVPSTMEFLKPEQTLEPTPNSLRDFIIALDKSKADKLRYKVEDKVVRIFITPYKTSITQDDLEFSQGDFNVDVIVALGAHEQAELDQAITEHGRILHDATVISINNTPNGNLGSVNWQEISASSISEMVTDLVKSLGTDVLDEQVATALLTGVVAETGRFSNEKTTPQTMNLAGDLLAAGANQQLVATELQADKHAEGAAASVAAPAPREAAVGGKAAAKAGDGTLEIDHEAVVPAPESSQAPGQSADAAGLPKILPRRNMLPAPESPISSVHGVPLSENPFTQEYNDMGDMPAQGRSYLIDEPAPAQNPLPSPSPTGALSQPDAADVLPVEPPAPLFKHAAGPALSPETSQPAPASLASPQLTPPLEPAVKAGGAQTLEEIEASVHSPHLTQLHPNVDIARNQVLEALKQGPQPLEPLAALNANPLGNELHPHGSEAEPSPLNIVVDDEGNMQQVGQQNAVPAAVPPPAVEETAAQPLDMPLPSVTPGAAPASPTPVSPNSPPPVPPPLPPNFMNPGPR